jgi:DNA-binding beta-propeller fold protein YncE
MHNQIIYYMSRRRNPDGGYLSLDVLRSVLNVSKLNSNINVLTPDTNEPIVVTNVAQQDAISTALNSYTSTPYMTNGNSLICRDAYQQRANEIERQKLEELYSLGFIIQEEYLARRSALEG